MSASPTSAELRQEACSASAAYLFIKRAADIVFSLLLIIVLSPLMLVLALTVKLGDRGKILFCHERMGKNFKKFKIYKFRTMVENADQLISEFSPEQEKEFAESFKLKNDPRVTPIGRFLRQTSLDELPQLFNILKGDMSFVGPRPITENELDFFGNSQALLLSVRPGLTGFWAANDRGHKSYRRRRAMEIYYVKNQSLTLDLVILLKTVVTVLKGDDAEKKTDKVDDNAEHTA